MPWTPSTTADKSDDVRTLLARLLAASSSNQQSAWVPYLASAARTASVTGDAITCTGYTGLLVYIATTAYTAGTLAVECVDPSHSNRRLNMGQVTIGSVTYRYTSFGRLASAGLQEYLETRLVWLPESCAIKIYHSTADSWTYSVEYCLLR